MSTTAAFLALLGGTIAWIALPFLPAVRELLAPRDAAPLDAVGSDAGPLTFFADSFRQMIDQSGYAGVGAESARLPDGRRIQLVADVAPLALEDDVGLLVGAHRSRLPEGATLPVETYGAGDLAIEQGVAARAVYAAGTLQAGERLSVFRWLHGESDVTIGDGARLGGRATARGTLRLGHDVRFTRLEAPRIAIGIAADRATGATGEATLETSATMPVFEPRGAGVGVMASQHWRVDGDLRIPAGHRVWGTLVVRGTLWIGAGCEVRGSVKAHRTVHVGEGTVVYGTVAAREDVHVGPGVEIRGAVIAEGAVTVAPAARIGRFDAPTSIAADRVTLQGGAIVYGAVSARLAGRTLA